MSAGMGGWESVGAFLAIVLAVAGLLKYVFYMLDKHKEHVDGRFKAHKQILDEHGASIRNNEKQIGATRDELHTEYVRNDRLDKTLGEQNKMLSAIFKKMDAMARDLNQLIGSHNGKVGGKDE